MNLKTALLNKRAEIEKVIRWHEDINDVFDLKEVYEAKRDELDRLLSDETLTEIDLDKFNTAATILNAKTYKLREVSKN